MNLISNLQKEYEQLWKYIIRPTRQPYSEKKLGSPLFKYQGHEAIRKDIKLKNSRGLSFDCSIWMPSKLEKANVVVYMHANSSNRLEGTEYLGRLIVAGIGLCTFDFSGCGNAEGEYVSLGYYQQEDLKLVLETLKIYPSIDRVALWGRSMGAVTALLYLPQDNRISAVVLDSPFKSLKGLIQDMAAKTTKIPGLVLSAAFKIISSTIKEKAKFSIYKLNPLKNAAPKIFIPAFFIVGVQDEIIPIEHTGELFEAYGSDDKVIKMVNGGHNDSRPALVIDSVIEFLKDRFVEQQNCEKALSETAISKTEQKEETVEQVQKQEIGEIQEAIKTGKFSWPKLFSLFSKSIERKEPEKIQELAKEQKTKIETKQEQSSPKTEQKRKQVKGQSDKYDVPLQEKLRQYSYCYI